MPLNKTVKDANNFLKKELATSFVRKVAYLITGTSYEHEQLKNIQATLEQVVKNIDMLDWLISKDERKEIADQLQKISILGKTTVQDDEIAKPSQIKKRY